MSEKTFTGLYLDRELLDDIARELSEANCRTRNEFINKAIRFYIAHLHCRNNSEVLTPALESVVAARIQDTEYRLARVLFKQGVELAMMMHVVAATNEIELEELGELRRLCVEEVSKLGGRVGCDDAVGGQRD